MKTTLVPPSTTTVGGNCSRCRFRGGIGLICAQQERTEIDTSSNRQACGSVRALGWWPMSLPVVDMRHGNDEWHSPNGIAIHLSGPTILGATELDKANRQLQKTQAWGREVVVLQMVWC